MTTSLEAAQGLIEKNLPVGTELQGGTSSVTEHRTNGERVIGVVVTRKATGSVVPVSTRMVAKTLERLEREEYFGKRGISGTTTVEATVVAAVGLRLDNGRYVQ